MKLLFTTILLTLVTISSFAQKEEVLKRLAEYNIEGDFLAENLKDQDATHSFDLKCNNTSNGTTKVELAHFDATKPVGGKWTLKSVDGVTPTSHEIKQFHKTHNTEKKSINGKIDDTSWKIVTDDTEYLVVSFKYDKETLPKKYAFLGDCTGTAYINKKTTKLEKITFVNDGPMKVKMLNVTKLNMNVVYSYNKDLDTYLMQKETLLMEVTALGTAVAVEETNEYTNYIKK